MKTFFFFGDSITLGVNDTLAGGWIGRFAGLASQRAGLPVPPSTFYNLGVRKQSSLQIRERWASEYRSRVNDATVPYLVFCFGTVDMAAPNGNVVVPMQESIQNAQAILSEAQMEAPVLMMGPPPVKNPDHLERLNKLNETYAGLCLDLGVAYLDLLKGLPAVYVADLDDGLHPGKTGNMLIAEQLLNAPIVQGWIRS
ncbi:GDSL-type esterase/lipase family protein [Bilophila wadsworthia]|uniref:GDSL-type esterase/lipase family protein n=1 Tax=Bilophila wadsworthia TaxID=35833 RepID=UPI0026764D2B|nr:GDSL-type esterase/lipase family protein [Bilophila wadsworthia]